MRAFREQGISPGHQEMAVCMELAASPAWGGVWTGADQFVEKAAHPRRTNPRRRDEEPQDPEDSEYGVFIFALCCSPFL